VLSHPKMRLAETTTDVGKICVSKSAVHTSLIVTTTTLTLKLGNGTSFIKNATCQKEFAVTTSGMRALKSMCLCQKLVQASVTNSITVMMAPCASILASRYNMATVATT